MRTVAALLLTLVAIAPARAQVVINEVYYKAPSDLDNLHYIELHNAGDRAVDLAGWRFTRGVTFTFPPKSTIAPGGFLVVCKDLKELKKQYGLDGAGQFVGSLKRNQGDIELVDAAGRRADRVRYGSRAPWPVAPDGHSSSLERICPTAPATGPENWAPSPPSARPEAPAGTPGKKNATHAAHLPPVIAKVSFSPANPSPKERLKVEAEVSSASGVHEVVLLHRGVGPGREGKEESIEMKKEATGRYAATLPAYKTGQIIRFRIRATDGKKGQRFFPHPNDLRPTLSSYVHDKFKLDKAPLGLIINVGPGRGQAAFVWVGAKSGEPRLFDHITVTPRKGGRKVRFHKDQPLEGMTTVNLIHEGLDRWVVAEALAYEVYRKAGNAACRTDIVRIWVDGRPIGFQLLIEQPNKAFLRHNKLRTDGNMYKVIWYGHGLEGQHEKKTNVRGGHDDLKALVAALNKVKGDEQWKLIKTHFDVEQVINYFAVNMLLSHWDGYFNNYFTYHDVKGTGKWTMYPWDQDKTWGYHDGIWGNGVFFDMPVTFGMAGDQPPRTFTAGIWWRGPGHFSGPLLANPTFRKLYLARLKELLEKVYTEEVFLPVIKQLGEKMQGEVTFRAELFRRNPKAAQQELANTLDVMRDHLRKRRKFLLAQDEVKNAGKFDRAALK